MHVTAETAFSSVFVPLPSIAVGVAISWTNSLRSVCLSERSYWASHEKSNGRSQEGSLKLHGIVKPWVCKCLMGRDSFQRSKAVAD